MGADGCLCDVHAVVCLCVGEFYEGDGYVLLDSQQLVPMAIFPTPTGKIHFFVFGRANSLT